MRALRVQMPPVKTKVVTLTGGLNEQVSNMELKAGELYDVSNYEEIDGEYHGLRSLQGFERFDGSVVNIENPLSPGDFIEVGPPSDVPLLFETDGTLKTDGDLARETRRAQIIPCPGQGPILACFWYLGEIYAIRESLAYPGFCDMYMAVRGTTGPSGGWTQITAFPSNTIPVVDPVVNPIVHTPCRFAQWPVLDPNLPSMAIAFGGVHSAIVMNKNAAGTHVVHIVDDSSASTPAGENSLPDSPAIVNKVYPAIVGFFNNRLFLGYNDEGSSGSVGPDGLIIPRDGGGLFFSNLGSPTFIVTTDYAGFYPMGSPITGLVVSPGEAIVVYMERGIKILKKIQPNASTGWMDMQVDEFSDRTNCINKTAKRFLGTHIFSGDRGIQFMDASDTYGDFSLASISKKVQKTFMERKEQVLQSFIHRVNNQYWLFFQGGQGLILTFDIEKKVKGATKFNYNNPITYVDEGNNWDEDYRVILGDASGYVHIVHDGAASFDGSDIISRFSSAYHHYGSPMHYKNFDRVHFEMQGQRGTQLYVRADFDYRSSDVPKAVTDSGVIITGSGGVWGVDQWGSFRWTGNVLETAVSYLRGFGTNCSINLSVLSHIYTPHVIHNFTMSYKQGAYKP